MRNRSPKPVAAGFFRDIWRNKNLRRGVKIALFAVVYGVSVWLYLADVPTQANDNALFQAVLAQSHRPAQPAQLPAFDVNTAQAYELELLPGVGEVIAARIVAYREQHGPFTKREQLLNVEGIGEGRLADIAPYLLLP